MTVCVWPNQELESMGSPMGAEAVTSRQSRWLTDTLELRDQLGRGSMATVWDAVDHRRGLRVAVKLGGDKPPFARAIYHERFRREALTTTMLASPHALRVLEHGVARQRPYIVMERLVGVTLQAMVDGCWRLNLPQTLTLLRQLSHPLAEAHALGIVHRDVKPSNVFLLAHPQGVLFAKLLDFGIVKRTDDPPLTKPNALIGTPAYMSPEQFRRGSQNDPRVDRWALAAVAYLALTGEHCFMAKSLAATVDNVIHRRFVRPSERRPGLPVRLDGWFERAFAADAEQRFRSTSAMLGSFAALLDPPDAR